MKRLPEYFTQDSLESYNNEFSTVSDESPELQEETKEKVTAYIKPPSEIDRDLLEEISFLINKTGHYKDKKTGKTIGPDTVDRLLESEWIGYVLNSNSIPVAAVTLVNTTEEGWAGVIPRNYYELKAGKSLGNKLERRMFTLDEDYQNTNVGAELERIIQEKTKDIYAVSVLDKVEDTKFLLQNGYDLIAEFDSDLTDNFLGLWIVEDAS